MNYREPKRSFERLGTVDPRKSYYVSLENVVNSDKQDMKTMVDLGKYFSIFAPRQSGKSTFLKEIRDQLHSDPTYVAIMLSFEDYKGLDTAPFYADIESELYGQLMDRLKRVNCAKVDVVAQLLENHRLVGNISLRQLLEKLNGIIEFKKIVIFIDEFDGIPLGELEKFLNSLRKLYLKYKTVEQKVLYSVGLVGIRDITKLIVGGVSPFNIADQVDLPPFSFKNIHDLYAQYTEETNQPFTTEAVKKIHQETGGQPWLVNRLGAILKRDIKPGSAEPIGQADVEEAIRLLLLEKNDHFDNLLEKAKQHKETFVRIVFNNVKYNPSDEEQAWLEQYGLITQKETTGKEVKAGVANNIYKARFVDAFFEETKVSENVAINDYVLPGGGLDMKRVLLGFEQYITQIGVNAFYEEKKTYEKTGQFRLTAWLYHFVAGDEDQLRFELRSGLGRLDILLTYKGRKYIIETKVNRYNDISRIRDEGIAQVAGKYLATEAAKEGYLVIFDTRTAVGTLSEPTIHQWGNKKVICFQINIGKKGN